jgi:hypothetical protein
MRLLCRLFGHWASSGSWERNGGEVCGRSCEDVYVRHLLFGELIDPQLTKKMYLESPHITLQQEDEIVSEGIHFLIAVLSITY